MSGHTDRRSGLVRAVMAEGATDERLRINAALSLMLDEMSGRSHGRAVLRRAIEATRWTVVLDAPYENHTGGAGSPHLIDSVDVGWTDDPNDDPDVEWPVRMLVVDGAASTTASAYLTVQDARDVAEALTFAADAAAAAQARRRAGEDGP